MSNIWDIAEEQTRKDVRAFNDVVKPALRKFYELSGEDIIINLNEFGKYDKPIITFNRGSALTYDMINVDVTPRSGYERPCNIPKGYLDLKYDEVYNIGVVRVCLDYWDQINVKLEERLKEHCIKILAKKKKQKYQTKFPV